MNIIIHQNTRELSRITIKISVLSPVTSFGYLFLNLCYPLFGMLFPFWYTEEYLAVRWPNFDIFLTLFSYFRYGFQGCFWWSYQDLNQGCCKIPSMRIFSSISYACSKRSRSWTYKSNCRFHDSTCWEGCRCLKISMETSENNVNVLLYGGLTEERVK